MTLAIFLTAAFAVEPAEDQLKLLDTFRNEFIAITPGDGEFPQTLTMGREEGGEDSERPVHKITFSYNFQIAKYEVPQNLWQAVMGENPSRWKGPRNSVEMLSLDEAQQFCQRATEFMRAAKLIRPNQIIRLPSESEWEYVARAGTTTLFSFGDDVDQIDDYAWHNGNAAGNDPPVGVKKPNPWGLYDMHGNVAEWVFDALLKDGYKQFAGKKLKMEDAIAWPKKLYPRVSRGGNWDLDAEDCRSAARLGSNDDDWRAEDPNIPLSPWWFTSGPSLGVGMRLIRPLGAVEAKDRDRYWEATLEQIREDVGYRIDEEGRGARGFVDPQLPVAIENLKDK